MNEHRREQLRVANERYYAKHRVAIWARRRPKQLARRTARRAFLNRWKLAAGCIDCGYTEHAVALDFDHITGEKSFGLGVGPTRGWRAMLDEIQKCVVRCANCHRIKTATPKDKDDQ